MTNSNNPTTIHRTLSLGNQDSHPGPNLQTLNRYPAPTRDAKKIPTFMIWSIFNLLVIPFGILCCYLSHRASQCKLQNRYEQTLKWSKRAFVGNIITTLLMFGIIITAVMLHYDYVQRNPPLTFNETQTTGAYIPWQPGR
jgi:hypothetical protein